MKTHWALRTEGYREDVQKVRDHLLARHGLEASLAETAEIWIAYSRDMFASFLIVDKSTLENFDHYVDDKRSTFTIEFYD